jgi:archaellum biogenesis ATPase FlaH
MPKWRFISRKIWKAEIILQDTFSDAMRSSTKEIEHYISSFPGEVQIILDQIRTVILQAAPDANRPDHPNREIPGEG